MKLLFLCVDRDDDLGVKAGVPSPVIGRRRNLEAALALGLADPEDSDTNAILAAVHLYDRELQNAQAQGDQVEVATITGLRTLGLRGDRKLAAELEEVLAATKPDNVVLVSDGAEDERILPILQSRTKVIHIHRSIVKQAPRLEGAFYTLGRILDEPKQARRFVLPIAVLSLFWGVAFLLGRWQLALGITLAFVGTWLLVHAMQWEGHVGRMMTDLGQSVRRGRIALFGNLLLLVILGIGAAQAWQDLQPTRGEATTVVALRFLQLYFPFVIIGFLVQAVGRLLDAWARGGRSGFGPWMAIITLIAMGFIGDVLLEVSLAVAREEGAASVFDLDTLFKVLIGAVIGLGGYLLGRYLRSFGTAARAS